MQIRQKQKKILVVGLGPIGGIFSSHLAASGHRVFGLDIRQDYIDAIRKNGISVVGLTSLHAELEQACTRLSEIDEQEFDYVVLAVKTPFMPDVVSKLIGLKGDFQVISMQNGIGNEDYLAEFFAKERVLRVAVNYAGNTLSPGVIKMTFFHKPNHVGCICGGEVCAHPHEIADIMTLADLETEPTEDIRRFTWQKTILVAALAPISALVGITMADVMAFDKTHHLVKLLLKEAIEVAGATGYDYGKDFFEKCVEYLSTAGPHKPSMLIDIENGQPTEINYINEKIADYGQEHNLQANLHTAITALVKAREHYHK